MTTVTLTEYPDRYEVKGEDHATGSSEVCAAISMMMISAANWALASGYEGEQRLNPGDALVTLPKKLRGSRTIYNLLSVSFAQLEDAEKDFVRVVQNVGQD